MYIGTYADISPGFSLFIRIEFEFYLLQKINGLYRCHNSHKKKIYFRSIFTGRAQFSIFFFFLFFFLFFSSGNDRQQ